jgi:hypothetical protein
MVNMLDCRETFGNISNLWLDDIAFCSKLFPRDLDHILYVEPAGAYYLRRNQSGVSGHIIRRFHITAAALDRILY